MYIITFEQDLKSFWIGRKSGVLINLPRYWISKKWQIILEMDLEMRVIVKSSPLNESKMIATLLNVMAFI